MDAAAATAKAADPPVRPRPRWRPVIMCWALAEVALTGTTGSAQPWAQDLLIGPVGREGFLFLGAVSTVLLVGAAICLTVMVATRPPAPRWTGVLAVLVELAVLGGLALLAYPALLIGALSFSTDHRTIGMVDGNEVIVEQGAGLGQFPISAGIRHGVFVSFSGSTGDTSTWDPVALGSMTFRMTDEGDRLRIDYTPGPHEGGGAGVLLVPKH